MVGRYRLIDRDYQGQLSRRLRSRVLMHAYATRGLGFLVCCAIISRQLGQGRQLSGGSPLFMINHRSSNTSVDAGASLGANLRELAAV